MGRRARRRRQDEQDGIVGELLEAVVALAWDQPWAGLIFVVGFFALAGYFNSLTGPNARLIGSIASMIVGLLAIVLLVVCIIAFLKQGVERLFGVRDPSRHPDPSASPAQSVNRQLAAAPATPTSPRRAPSGDGDTAARPRLEPSAEHSPYQLRPDQSRTRDNPEQSQLPAQHPPYQRQSKLLSDGEFAFYDVLKDVVGPQYVVHMKVRLMDLLHLPRNAPGRMLWLSKASQKHVDFVLCTRDRMEPVLVIELDDRSHDRPRRAARDASVDQALASAQIRLLRVRSQQAYDVAELRQTVASAMAEAAKPRRRSSGELGI